jgi:hypothetical protein
VTLARKSYNAIISFPRSGTDFFCDSLKTDPNIKYFREYFNPVCNSKREDALVPFFGDESIANYMHIMKEIDDTSFSSVMDKSWKLDQFNTTKENFSASKIDHFDRYFNVIMLARSLYHTFPTSKPEYIVPIYNSFMISNPYKMISIASEMNELRSFMSYISIENFHQAGIAAYMIQHYALFLESSRLNISVISYEDIMEQDGPELETTLQPVIQFGANPAKLAAALKMNQGKSSIDLGRRRDRFCKIFPDQWY